MNKSNGIVIWDSVHYLIKCQKQLSEKEVFEKLERSPLEKFTKRMYSTTWKSVRVWSFSGPYFPALRLNTDQKNSEYGHFSRSAQLWQNGPWKEIE